MRLLTFQNHRRGETLVEVLGAFFILTVISSAATLFITQTNRTSKLVEDRLVAENLASDGIEAMIMFRNTNWMKFADKTACWDVEMDADKCPGFAQKWVASTNGATQRYKVVLNPNTLQWSLENYDSELDLKTGQQADVVNNKFYGLFPKTDAPNKGLLVNFSGNVSPPGDPRFYRMIKLTRLDPDAIKIESKVQWISSSTPHAVTLSNVITNY